MSRPHGWAASADRVVLAALDQSNPSPQLKTALLSLLQRFGLPVPPKPSPLPVNVEDAE